MRHDPQAWARNLAEGGGHKHYGGKAVARRLGLTARDSRAGVGTATRRMGEMVKALSKSWMIRDGSTWDDVVKQHRAIRKELEHLGQASGWSHMGKSIYIRPRVGRKIWLLLCAEAQLQDRDWGTAKGPKLSVTEFVKMFPDVKNLASRLPKHWRDMRYIRQMGPSSSPSLHSCWTCLINYATQGKARSEESRQRCCEFIKQRLREMDVTAPARAVLGSTGAATDVPTITCFAEMRAALAKMRGCTPTPLMVLRACTEGLPQPGEDPGPRMRARR